MLYNAKIELRKSLIDSRKSISKKSERDASMFHQLINMKLFAEADIVFSHVSKSDEIDTLCLIRYCFALGKRVAVPKVFGDEMRFYILESEANLARGGFGVLEPTSLDNLAVPTADSLCVVPALACDKNGYRLGYGKGYYDRYLTSFPGKTVCLCYKQNLMDIPTNEWDIPVDIVLTDELEASHT